MIIRRIALVLAFLCLALRASAQDRVAAVQIMERNCENGLLADSQRTAGLLALNIGSEALCACAARLAVGRLSPADITTITAGRPISLNPAAEQQIWKFCVTLQVSR